jgi:hypothetical protein
MCLVATCYGVLRPLMAMGRDPVLHRLGDELRYVVGPDVSANAPQDEQVGQNVDHIGRFGLAGETDRQTRVNSSSNPDVRA